MSQRIEGSKKLASASGLLVGLCRVQFFAKHFRGPIRYRLRDFLQLPANKLRYNAVSAAMRGVVVDD